MVALRAAKPQLGQRHVAAPRLHDRLEVRECSSFCDNLQHVVALPETRYLFSEDVVHETEIKLTDAEYARRIDELDRVLNDPDVPMEPNKVWSLLAEITQRDLGKRETRRAGVGSRANPAN